MTRPNNQLATDDEIRAALKACGGNRGKAARMLGISERRLYARLSSILGDIPESSRIRGTSTLYDADGNPKLQWIKADHEKERAAIEAYAMALAQKVPAQKPTAAPKLTEKHLLNLYTLTDCHVGALSWDRETGADWDVDIADRTISEAFRLMIEASPKADACIVNQLGDFLHFDSLAAVTPTSGHILDSDSRYQKVVEVAVRILRRIVNMALDRHRRVHIVMADANHDPVGGTWLRVLFSALYENEKRVTVETSPRPYVVYQHGQTMLAFHHGHQAKMEKLPAVFASEFPDVWGATRKRYAHTGHYHHSRLLEDAGMIVEQHPTIAARDAYAARLGLHAIRAVNGITYHNRWGQIGRISVYPEMIE